MEYPFKDLLPLDEVLEREGYYKDWTHLDPKVFYSLTQISEYIKTKGFGVDVRLLIAQLAEHFGLKTSQINEIERLFKDVMRELSEDKDYHSLPEIAGARGGENTLGERLDKEHNEVTAQLAQTSIQLGTKRDKAVKIKGTELETSSDVDKVKLINLADEVQQALTGNAPALTTIAAGTVVEETIADGANTIKKLEPLLQRRGFSQIKQGIDPAYEDVNPWQSREDIGTSLVEWKSNTGEFLEGNNYVEISRGDTSIATYFFAKLRTEFQKNTSKQVRIELTYNSSVQAKLTMFQNDKISPSGLLTNANVTLPSTSGVEKTVDLVGYILPSTVYIVPHVAPSTTGGTVKVGSVKVSVLTGESSLPVPSEQRTPIGETISFWSGNAQQYLNFDMVNREILIPVGGIIFRNRLKLLEGYPSKENGYVPYPLPIPAGSSASLYGLFYNANSESTDVSLLFKTLLYTQFDTLNEDWVLLATFSITGTVNMAGAYSINGNYLGVDIPVMPDINEENRKLYTSTADSVLLEVTENETSIDKADFVGANNATYTSESGLYMVGKQFNRLRDSTFKNFKGLAGLRVGNTVGTHSTLTASDLLFLNNKIGFLSEVRAEYIVISNSQFNQNEIGAQIRGGNVQITNSMICDNVNGIEILAGSNDSHGIISNCQINHNTGIALLIDGISVGETISSCHFYDATIHIKNTLNKPVRFDNCVIAGDLILENNAKVIFNNCFFPAGYGLVNSVITDTLIEGHGNEIEETQMESVFNTY